MRVALVTRALDTQALLDEVADRGRGATALFVGTVRSMSEGREVTAIEYTAYEAMAIKEMSGILSEAEKRHEGVVLVAEHRIGRVEVGAASIAIAAAHAHRAPALDALRYAIDEIKARVPIWKHELYADGTDSWVEPSESPVT
jgi:molybdopterin synthase catalytic subunit